MIATRDPDAQPRQRSFRGRVMGVRMMVSTPTPPLGLLAAGSLIDLKSASSRPVTLYAGTGLMLMLAIAIHWRDDLWPLQNAPRMRGRPTRQYFPHCE